MRRNILNLFLVQKAKRTLIGIITLICLTGVARSQDVSFGIRGGLNLATFAGNPAVRPAALYHFGFLLEKKLNDKFILQPNLLFSAYGATEKSPNAAKYTFQYTCLQLHFKNRIGTNVSLIYGPQVSTLVNATVESEGKKEQITTSKLKPIDIGLSLGLHIKVQQRLSFVVAANASFLENHYPLSERGAQNNLCFQFGLVYLFTQESKQ